VSAEVERLRTQHADAVREKSAAESKCRKLADKVAALEGEKIDLRRQLAEERKEANEALAKAQATQAEANLARAEGSLAKQRAEQLEERLSALQARVERAEASTRSEAERTRKQLMDSYHELGAWTADFEVPDREPRLRCLEWIQEELLALPAIVEGFMSYASLVTCEGAMSALSCEGCRHYEVFDQADEDFERDIYKVEDPVVKESAGALYDRMWGPHCGGIRNAFGGFRGRLQGGLGHSHRRVRLRVRQHAVQSPEVIHPLATRRLKHSTQIQQTHI
jgi:small-conductance mechanosensitive channel